MARRVSRDVMDLLAGGKIAFATGSTNGVPNRDVLGKPEGGPAGVMFPSQQQMSPVAQQALMGGQSAPRSQMDRMLAAMNMTGSSPAQQMELRRQMRHGGGLGIDRRIRAAQGRIGAEDESSLRQEQALERIRTGKVEPQFVRAEGMRDVAEINAEQKDRAIQLKAETDIKIAELDTAVGLRKAEATLEGTRYQADRDVFQTQLEQGGMDSRDANKLSTQIAVAKMETDLGRDTNDLVREKAGLEAQVKLLTQGVVKGTTAAGRLDIGAATPEQLADTRPTTQPTPSRQAAGVPAELPGDLNRDGRIDEQEESYNRLDQLVKAAKDKNNPYTPTPAKLVQMENDLKKLKAAITGQ